MTLPTLERRDIHSFDGTRLEVQTYGRGDLHMVIANGLGGTLLAWAPLLRALEDFEALFLARMMKIMRQSVPSSGLWGNGPGKGIYDSFMDQELGKKLAQREGLGLGKKIYHQVLKREEKSEPLSAEDRLRAAGGNEEVDERVGGSSTAGLSDDRR